MARKKKGEEPKAPEILSEEPKKEEPNYAEAGKNRFFGGGEKPSEIVKKTKKADKQTIEFEKKFDLLCAASILAKVATAIRKSLKDEYISSTVFPHFKEEMSHTKRQGQTFEAVSVTGRTAAQWQYRKKGFGFKADIADILRSFDVPYETNVKAIEGWMLNPEISENNALIDKLSDLLERAAQSGDFPELLNKKVFIPQEGKKSFTFSDLTIQGIVDKCPEEIQNALLNSIAEIALAKPTLDGQEVSKKCRPTEGLLEKAFSLVTQSDNLDSILAGLEVGSGDEE